MSEKKKKIEHFIIDEFPTINVQDDEGNLISQYGKKESKKIIDSIANQFIGKSKDTNQESN